MPDDPTRERSDAYMNVEQRRSVTQSVLGTKASMTKEPKPYTVQSEYPDSSDHKNPPVNS